MSPPKKTEREKRDARRKLPSAWVEITFRAQVLADATHDEIEDEVMRLLDAESYLSGPIVDTTTCDVHDERGAR